MEKVDNPGINKENLESALNRIKEKIGDNWASNDPAVLASYSRDFTIQAGNWPNIVAIPGSTEEVQEIIKIANDHKIPVVPMSSGFNHGGMCVPRKGGIMLDLLKRMDKVLDIDTESMTMTIQPGVRNAVTYAKANELYAIEGVRRLTAALPLTMGSASTLSNYFCRGGAASLLRHGNTPESIVNMTIVLPDGDVLRTGPGAQSNVGNVPIANGVGPDISGMFINSSGIFGICTEMTIKLFPEPVYEELMVFDLDDRDRPDAFEQVIEWFYRVPQLDVCDMMYKAHGGTMANSAPDPDVDREDLAESMGEHVMLAIVTGDTEEETRIKAEMVEKAAESCGMYKVFLEMFVEAFGGQVSFAREPRSRIGTDVGLVMGGKGSFQWMACCPKLEKIPAIAREYDHLLDKYWKPTDPEFTRARTMAGTAIQGPFQFGRMGTLEFDYWWDPGNVESVKRATRMIEKAVDLDLKHGAPLWRNMYNHGEKHIPKLGVYTSLLYKTKREFDPDNLMHPDIIPCTDDYI